MLFGANLGWLVIGRRYSVFSASPCASYHATFAAFIVDRVRLAETGAPLFGSRALPRSE